MKTLIIPCGGKSSRFPDMKPKYLLTYPDGKLMIEKSISGLPLNLFDRIIITIIKEHDQKYESALILNQIFGNNIEICILDEFTKCQSETVYLTVKKMEITDEIVVKDSDNYVEVSKISGNFVVGLNIAEQEKDINRLKSKSFLVVNEQNIIVDIIEKEISSNYICLGVYGFENVEDFCRSYEYLMNEKNEESFEIYLSHTIAYMIGANKGVFRYVRCSDFEDWGTLYDWELVRDNMRTFFIDFDGVIVKNTGKYGSRNWSEEFDVIPNNIKHIKNLYDRGAQIVITTSREKEHTKRIYELFRKNGIVVHEIVTNCNHSKRIIINDFAPTNPFPCCESVSIPRNGNLSDYLK